MRNGGAELTVDRLTWRPVRRRTPVLTDVTLHVPAGQRVLLAGPSGAGKSTLLRAMAGVLRSAASGDLEGSVTVGGHLVTGRPGRVGLLQQDPTANAVAETAGRDVAFGLENRGLPRAEIWPRVDRALRAAGFPFSSCRPSAALSGGEAQRLALAGALVLDAEVLLLDEPTSMLDPPAADAVRSAIRAQVDRVGATTVVVSHRLSPWLGFADRLIVLGEHGTVVADGPPATVLAEQAEGLLAQGVWVPAAGAPTPARLPDDLVGPWRGRSGELVGAVGVEVRLRAGLARRQATVALRGVDAKIVAGRALALTGRSGAGKSTLLAVLAGLLRPTAGSCLAASALATRRGREPWRWSSRDLAARLAWVPQLPEHGVVARTVRDEVEAAGRACRRDPARLAERVEGLLDAVGLGRLAAASPYHLSGGEQRRLMVAAALAHGPSAILLDEPTVGQDRGTWAAVAGLAASARQAGSGVVIATHDEDAVKALADDVLELDRGTVP